MKTRKRLLFALTLLAVWFLLTAGICGAGLVAQVSGPSEPGSILITPIPIGIDFADGHSTTVTAYYCMLYDNGSVKCVCPGQDAGFLGATAIYPR